MMHGVATALQGVLLRNMPDLSALLDSGLRRNDEEASRMSGKTKKLQDVGNDEEASRLPGIDEEALDRLGRSWLLY